MTVLEKILSSSQKLFMNYGLKSISMDDIASDIGISKKTIYKHFSTKDRLINITLTHFLKQEKKTVAKIYKSSHNAVEEIILIGRHIIKMTKSLKPTLIFDLKKYHTKNWQLIEEHHTEFIKQVITENLERGISEGLFRSDLRPEIIARLYVAKSLLIANDSNFSHFELGLDEIHRGQAVAMHSTAAAEHPQVFLILHNLKGGTPEILLRHNVRDSVGRSQHQTKSQGNNSEMIADDLPVIEDMEALLARR